MNIFLDTSSLFKMYHRESGTDDLIRYFTKVKPATVYVAEISKIEFASAIWKKVRSKEITEIKAKDTIEYFDADYSKYAFKAANPNIIEYAKVLISKYRIQGLRTLDGIQLSTALTLFNQVDLFITHDKLLKTLFIAEGFPTELPNLL